MHLNKINNGADAIIQFLKQMEVSTIHNYPGGTIAPLLDACNKYNLKIFTSRHEQGAGYAALAQAKLSGLPGIVAVTSGPGATNVLTPVADAYFDSIPLVVFTGQVGTSDLRRESKLRQRGFQEANVPSLMKDITKAQYQPLNVSDLLTIIPQAWQKSISGRKGPVLVDLPMDVQRAAFSDYIPIPSKQTLQPVTNEQTAFLSRLMNAIKQSTQPVILCGNGMMDKHQSSILNEIRSKWKAPVSQSLLGIGLIDSSSAHSLGFHGHTGSPVAGTAISNADLLLVLGSRLDVRQTGTQTNSFAQKAKIFRVDIDSIELEHSRISLDDAIVADLHELLPLLLEELDKIEKELPVLYEWHSKIARLKDDFEWPYPKYPGIAPQQAIEQLSKAVTSPVICVTGVGSHQHWVARHFRFNYPKRQLFTSAGHGAMGYDLPTAIGAAIHSPDHQIYCIVGDGSLQMNIQELGIIAEHNLNVKILVFNNHRLGLVSQFQLMNWKTDTACGNKTTPDFCAIANGYGIRSLYARTKSDYSQALMEFVNAPGAVLFNLEIDKRHDILPMLLGGQDFDKMWPYYDEEGQARKL
jgi:acetolactate synthase-1/2/3 large subunit